MTAIIETADTKPVSTEISQAIGDAINEVLRRFLPRQTLNELAVLDDHMLADIGIHRTGLPAASLSEIEWIGHDIHAPRHLIG